MGPELLGYTHEGFPVEKCTETGSLSFTLFSIGKESHLPWFGFSLSIQHNKTPEGKRRPYLILQVGKILMQSGWLF